MVSFLIAYLLLLAGVSAITCVVYGVDKLAAKANRRRVPEATLHVLELLGGWPGALVAQRIFRHKTQKWSFLLVFWLMVALHCILVAGAAYFVWQSLAKS